MTELKNIYRGDEVKFANLFRSLRTALLEEFLKAHPDFQTGAEFNSVNYYNNPTGSNNKLYSKDSAWKMTGVKVFGKLKPENKKLYPTAYDLVEAFGDNCFIGCYSIFEPNTILYRHTGTENRKAENIRIHIPLYIPDGDIGFEVEGEEILWHDVFSFNNQKLHSGWNNTNERRLVFLIDLKRSICDLPAAPEWYPGMNDHVPFFEKTKDPNIAL
jgi:aspartyl/asparaginyl beta-hydroxylase (cupin superfamily)